MAGASMNGIKSRIKSVSGTMQITKAMELVATSKLRRAKEKAENSRPFHEILRKTINAIETSSEVNNSVWSKAPDSPHTLFIVIAGDRGLAGGYNANVFRLVSTLTKDSEPIYLPIGKKAQDYYAHRKCNVFSNAYPYVADLSSALPLCLSGRSCS